MKASSLLMICKLSAEDS